MSFPRYPAYKPSGVEWLGEAPEHWDVIEARREIAFLTSGSRGWAEYYSDEGPVFLRIGNLTRDSIHIDLEDIQRVNPPPGGEGDRTQVLSGDVLFSITAYLGSVAVVPQDLERAYVSQHVCLARLTGRRLLPEWLAYSVLSCTGKAYLESESYGGTKVQLSLDDIKSFLLPLPPLDEQRALTSLLDRETAKIDALIAEQQRLIELLQEKRQAVISHAVTKGLNPDAPMKDSGVEWLGEVPEHWEVIQLNQLITKITNGFVGPTRDILKDEGVRYLQSLHIKSNRILFDVPYYVSEEWSATKEKSILREGDVLVVQTGDIGQSAVVTKEFEGCNCHALIVIAPQTTVLTGAWLSWVLNSTFGKETLLSIQTGALHPHLNCGNVKYISIPVPPIEEQAAICNYIAAKNLEADELIDASYQSIELMRERRSALISAAVTGQIDVRGLAPDAGAA